MCDGHGGDDYVRSSIGSKIGCAVAEKNIKNFFLRIDKETFLASPDKHLKNLEASIIKVGMSPLPHIIALILFRRLN